MTELAERPGPGLDLEEPDERMIHNLFLRMAQYKRDNGQLRDMVAERDEVIVKQRDELAELRRELRRLRRGEGVSVLIEGRTFPVVEPSSVVTSSLVETPPNFAASDLMDADVRGDLSQKLAAVKTPAQTLPEWLNGAEQRPGSGDDWLNSEQRRPDTEKLDASLIMFKE